QLMQAAPSLVAGIVAVGAALGAMELELAVLPVVLEQTLVGGFHRALAVLLEGLGILQLCTVFVHELIELLGFRRIRFLAPAAEPLGQTLGQSAKQGVAKL